VSVTKTISLIYKIRLLQKLAIFPHVPCLNNCIQLIRRLLCN
jgi:hypothetical protein